MAMDRALHPLTMWGFFTALAVGVIASDNWLTAAAAIAISALVVHNRKQVGPWGSSFRWSIIAATYLLTIRLFTGIVIGVPRPGNTLFTIPRIHLPSWLPGIRIGGPVTLERVTAALSEGLIIATVIIIFGAANSVTSPKKLLRTLPTFIHQLGTTMVIATSVFPQLISSITRIKRAQFLRSGKKPSTLSVGIPLLEESLTRAVALAESMEARGFGISKKASRYRPIAFTAVDLGVVTSGFVAALAMVAL
jgi:energy-coupling factor transporter transmembrane protein EcfT